MNTLDKTIAYFSPRLGAERLANRNKIKAFASYEGANRNPRNRDPQGLYRGMRGHQSESKALPIADRITLINEIQDLLRNDGGLINTILTRMTDHVVGRGIYPQARTDDDAWNEAAERWFVQIWSNTFDFEGRQGFSFIGDGQRLLINDAHVRGESFIRLLSDMRVQWFESELCRDPAENPQDRIYEDGFHLGPAGWTYGVNMHFKRSRDQQDIDLYIPRRDLVHCHVPFVRSRQRRGVPVFASVVPRMQQYLKTVDAMQLKVLLEAQQTLSITGQGAGGQVLNDMPFGGTEQDNDSRTYNKSKFDEGMLWDLPDGKTISSVESRTPSGEHMPYMDKHVEAICACMGVPFSVAMMLTGGSYSATRGQILAFEHTVNRWHDYVEKASQRMWNWAIAKAVKEQALPPAPVVNGRSQWDRVEWTQPKRMVLNPLEDQKVYDAAFARGDMTMTEILKHKNKELKATWDEEEREIRNAIERAQRITSETGMPVDWQVFYNKQRPGAPPAPVAEGQTNAE